MSRRRGSCPVIAAAAAAALGLAGCGSGDGGSGQEVTFGQAPGRQSPAAQVIAQADRICVKSRHDYAAIESPVSSAGDLNGFDTAKAKIDAEAPQRYRIARKVGFKECSPRP